MQQINILNVTDEQISKCRRIEHNGDIYYLVENSKGALDENGEVIEYTVRYLKGKGLTCTCPAGNPPCDEHGFLAWMPRTCWHLRAVVAHVQSLREEHKGRSQIDEYVRQGCDLETAMRVTFAKPTQYSEAEVKRAELANQARPFSILR